MGRTSASLLAPDGDGRGGMVIGVQGWNDAGGKVVGALIVLPGSE